MQVFSVLKTVYPIVLSSILFAANYSHASVDNLEFNGFYTISADYSSDDQLIVGPRRGSRVNPEGNITFNNSIIGAKINYQFNDTWQAVVQGRAFKNESDSIGTDTSWAYVDHDLGNDNQLRAGLFQTPFLQGTELRSIGYGRLWAKPIILDNGAGGFNEYTGLDYIQKYSSVDHYWQWQISLGKARHDVDHVDGGEMALATILYGQENWWLRSAITHIEYTNNRPDLGGLDGNISMISIESFLAFQRFEFHSGFSISDSHATPSDTMFYLSTSYPLETHTPYIYFSWNDQDFAQFLLDSRPPPRPSDGLPPPPPMGAPPPNSMDNPPPPLIGNSTRYSIALGDRYELMEGMAAKFQIECTHYNNKAGVETLGVSDDSVNISLSLEGVF